MSRIARLILAAGALSALVACIPDDIDTGPAADDTASSADDTSSSADDTASADAGSIVGDWLSQGDDVSELLAAYDFVRVDASFRDDGSYSVTSMDGAGATTDFTGTYTVGTGTDPHTITLSQDAPSAATAEGIWAVSGDALTYEVVQTEPDYGFNPPTPEGGFGSTSGPGIQPDVNIQTFIRQ